MIVFVRDRVPLVLSVVAILALLTAAFIRPGSLPTMGLAPLGDFHAFNAARPEIPGRTYAFDVIIAGGDQLPITPEPVPVAGGETIGIVGWALDSYTMLPGRRLLAGWDEPAALRPVTTYGLKRPDVAAALDDPEAVVSGFHADISLAGVRAGVHHVRFVVIAPDGRRTILPTRVGILVK